MPPPEFLSFLVFSCTASNNMAAIKFVAWPNTGLLHTVINKYSEETVTGREESSKSRSVVKEAKKKRRRKKTESVRENVFTLLEETLIE